MNRSNPFSDFDAFFERMSRNFGVDGTSLPRAGRANWDWHAGDSTFPMDLEDEGDAFVLTADLPGYEKSDIDLSVDGRTLTLSGHREHESGHESEHGHEGMYIHRERRSESVSRSVRFPADVDAESASASYTNGVLTVTVPKVVADEDGHRIDVE